jgi:hypothetical protein
MKVQIILQLRSGHTPPVAPDGFRREQNGVVWEYVGECSDWETAQSVGKQLSEQDGVYSIEIYNVAMWEV